MQSVLSCASRRMKLRMNILFRFSRKAMLGAALPSWLLSSGTVLLRRFVRNKGEALCDPVKLIEANGHHAVIAF